MDVDCRTVWLVGWIGSPGEVKYTFKVLIITKWFQMDRCSKHGEKAVQENLLPLEDQDVSFKKHI